MSTCANCGSKHAGVPDECLLAVCVGVLRHGRETISDDGVAALLADVNADEFWDRIGPVLDWLENEAEVLTADDAAPEEEAEEPAEQTPRPAALLPGTRVQVTCIDPDNDLPHYRAKLGCLGRVMWKYWEAADSTGWGSVYLIAFDGEPFIPFTDDAWEAMAGKAMMHDGHWIYPRHSAWFAGELTVITDDDNAVDE